MISFPIWAIESAGKFIDQQRGEEMGATVNKLTNDSSSSIGSLLVQAMITYIVVNQGLIFICSILFKSFDLMPIASFSLGFDKQHIISVFVDYCYYWVIVALPVVLLMFIVDFTFGLVELLTAFHLHH
jgi:type III secretion protein T